jgi:hypothetical protein
MLKTSLAALGAALALVCSLPAFAQQTQNFNTPQGTAFQGTIAGVGTPPDTNSVCMLTHGTASITVTLSGTWVATVQFWYTPMPGVFALLPMGKIGGGGPVNGTTGNGTFFAPVTGYTQVCTTALAYTSGTIVAYIVGSQRSLSPEQSSTLNFIVNSTPAVNTQATATQAAAGAGVRHVGTTCSGSINTVAAQPAITLNLRNGASGAGTVIWSMATTCAIGTSCTLSSPQLVAVGSGNAAMTCEWNAIPAVGNFETATLTGYDIP